METSYLSEVQESVKKYAQVISNIIGMDVDIADDRLTRIAGTGIFSKSVGQNIADEGYAFGWAIRRKEFVNIDNPGKNEICRQCPNQNNCEEKYEICCPILLEGEAIGAMAIATFDEKKISYITENLNSFKDFLENIADLIAAKVAEYRDAQSIKTSLELLKKMIDFINEGVMVFKNDKSILFLNRKAERLLGYELRQIEYLIKIKEFSIRQSSIKEAANNAEYQFKVRGKVTKIKGNVSPILVDDKAAAYVFVFEDVAALHQNFFQTGHETINFSSIIGKDKNFCKVKQQAIEYACNNRNLLIRGESGTGKEVFAHAICNESPRRHKPFVTFGCNGTPDTISEKELFGFMPNSPEEKGISKFELASGGTLFVDGIDRLPLRLQSRLANYMNENPWDVRIIAATSGDLEEEMKAGSFTESLYYRLDVYSIRIPPVRKRKKDIRLLVDYFLDKYNTIEGKEITLDSEVYEAFDGYLWPGNVREIDSVVGLIVTGAIKSEPVRLSDLPSTITEKLIVREDDTYNLKELEKRTILRLLNNAEISTKGKEQVAKALGISVASLYRKLKEYQITEKASYEFSK